MKTLKTLGLLLLLATGVLAQPDPNDMFIDGYVLDSNGQAVANHQVCVSYVSNNPALPSDSVCATTNANGYYFINITNGSLTGPNVTYEVSTYDPCALVPHVQTLENYQGTIDTANVNFAICATNIGCNGLEPVISTTVDTTNGSWVYVFSAGANGGTAPYTYQWGGVMANQVGQTVTYQAAPNEVFDICLAVVDANGCSANTCDTVYVGGNSGQSCSVDITTTVDSIGGGLLYTLVADPGFTAYSWSTGETTQTITVQNPSPNGDVICVSATTANGCTATACDTLLPINNGNCFADFWYQTNQNGNLVVGDTVIVNYAGSQSILNSYSWTVQFNGQIWTDNNQNLILAIPPTLVPIGGLNVEVCVTVSDALTGCSDSYCETITLVQPNSNGGCSGTITTTVDSSLIGFTYTFVANPTGVAPFQYFWFNGATGQSIFFDPSNINWDGIACVTIVDATGCSVTVCDTVGQNPNPNLCSAYFTWTESNILGSPLPAIEFTDQSQGAASWYWDFGDNTSSTDQNPLHTYNGAGTYFVCLTIVNADQSCQQTYCDTVVVGNSGNGNCSAAFTSSGPTPIGYTFTANVQNNNLYYQWSIDNQNLSGNGYEILAPGLTNGVHTICLTVIDSLNNCSDTQCQTITVGSNNCYGYISGQLYAGSNNQPLDEGVVYLITYDANTNQLTAVDSMVVDSGNYYFFGPLACGDYLIKAAAYPGSQYYNNHIPTYYGNSPFWGFAQTVTLGQVNTQVTADIFLIAANNPGGPGFIGGDVTQGANKTDPGDPLEGMQVMLLDLNDNAIAYTYTDANGQFGFSNLAYGTYKVYVEKLGVATEPAYVTIGPDQPSVDDVQIVASETVITTGINDFDFEGAISEVYPNPVGADASINFNLETGVMVNINILDLAGRTISTSSHSISSGENQVRFDVGDLTEGYYFLNIQDVEGAFSVTRNFMRVD